MDLSNGDNIPFESRYNYSAVQSAAVRLKP